MPFITDKYHWFPVWGFLAVLLLWKGGKQGRIVVLLIIPVIFLSDQISSHVIKPWIARPRPCITLPDVHLLTNKRTSFSFPSSHAANFFAVAAFFSYFYKKYCWWFFSVAALVAYSRIYIGIHYPFDAIAGAVLGIFCTCFVITTWQFSERLIKQFIAAKNRKD
jgi:undecaprenyl-diphosphatase